MISELARKKLPKIYSYKTNKCLNMPYTPSLHTPQGYNQEAGSGMINQGANRAGLFCASTSNLWMQCLRTPFKRVLPNGDFLRL